MRIEFRIEPDGSKNAVIEEENMVPGAECEVWLLAFSNLCENMDYQPLDPVQRTMRRRK